MRRILTVLLASAVLAGCGAASKPVQEAGLTADRTATTVPSAVVVAVGDIACPPGSAVTATTCRQGATERVAAALKPQRVLALGDLQYETGSYAAYTGSYAKSWGALLPITYPVPGNHEYGTSGAAGYFRYFSSRQPGSPGWYRRSLNGWQFYLLNSNCSLVNCSNERSWLAQQLAAHPSKCALIAFHHPRYSSGGEHGSNSAMNVFWKTALQYHVDVALAGHDHDYERFAPMGASGNLLATGIQEFVSGTGGKSLYPRGATVPGSRFFLNTTPGVLKLTLRPAGYSWQYVDLGMKVRDSGSAACR